MNRMELLLHEWECTYDREDSYPPLKDALTGLSAAEATDISLPARYETKSDPQKDKNTRRIESRRGQRSDTDSMPVQAAAYPISPVEAWKLYRAVSISSSVKWSKSLSFSTSNFIVRLNTLE